MFLVLLFLLNMMLEFFLLLEKLPLILERVQI